MNTYLMSIRHYVDGDKEFTIDATSKKEALEKAAIYVRQNAPYMYDNNYNINDIRCVKKIKIS